MLVLTRKKNQSIMIGDEIEVSILSISGDKVRIGIAAPREVPVFRTEVYISMRSEGPEGAVEAVNEALEQLSNPPDSKPPA